ncbi:DUF2244 domain-containing protein [Methylothermus subterraneus]
MPVFAAVIVHEGGNFQQRWILSPNASLRRSQAKALLGLLGTGMALIGGGFAWAGAWPVLPFAGIELWLLGYGLNWSLRQSATREIITLDAVKIRIEQVALKKRCCHEYYRIWARLEWSRPKRWHEAPRLYLGSHGKRVEIGAFLIEEEKQALAKSLRQALASQPTTGFVVDQ